MANICNVELVLYTDKNNLENLERARKAILDDNENDFIADIGNTEIAFGKFICYHYYGWCKWSLRYDLLNKFAKKYNVRWASAEEEPGLDVYVINDEEGFFNDLVYSIDESSYSFGVYYKDFDEMFEKDIKSLLNQEKLEEIKAKIEHDVNKYGVCNLDYDDVTIKVFILMKMSFSLKLAIMH